GLIQNIGDLLQRYPSEFMNLSYAMAGGLIFSAAVKHLGKGKVSTEAVEGWLKQLQETEPAATRAMAAHKAFRSMKMENWFNLGVGGFTTGSGLLAMSIKEKAHDPDDSEKHGLAGFWEWIRERPLSIAGAGYMVSTLLHAASTWVAMKGHDAKHK